MSNNTILIIVVASAGTVVLITITILSMWLYRRHKRRQAGISSTRGSYKKLQKRPRDVSSNSKFKSWPAGTTATMTTNSSLPHHCSISISEYQNQPLQPENVQPSYIEAQDPFYQQWPQRDYTSSIRVTPGRRRDSKMSMSSQSSLRPDQASKSLPKVPLRSHPPKLPSDRVVIIDNHNHNHRRRSSSVAAVDLNRTPSTRVANHYTKAEYVDLIDAELAVLMGHGSPPGSPAPLLPRRSSRRGSVPASIEGKASRTSIDGKATRTLVVQGQGQGGRRRAVSVTPEGGRYELP